MEKIVAIVTRAPKVRSKDDDDVFDRLSNRYTVVILVVFAIIVSMHAYVGKPITCWAPKHFTGSHTKYTNSFCWVRNTYYLPWDQNIPKPHEDDKRDFIPYYQWVPFILLAQAVLFYIPSVVWHGLNQKSGMDADDILSSANTFTDTKKVENRDKVLTLITKQMDRFMSTRKTKNIPCNIRHVPNLLCAPFGHRFGSYLMLLFLLSKLLYIVNVIAQLFLLNSILATQYNIYGWEVITNMVADHDWTQAPSVVFPRVTLCDFNIRRLGNVHRYTVQCVLPINLYTEKIYMFLWFWMVIVAIFTCIGFFVWLTRMLCRGDRLQFVKNHLVQMKKVDPGDNRDQSKMADFLDNYLRQDGAFLLRLIGHNTNNITVTEIMCSLYDAFLERRSKKDLYDDEEGDFMSDKAREKEREAFALS